MFSRFESDDIYRALVADLAHSIVPTSLMGMMLVGVGAFAATVSGMPAMAIAATVGGIASLGKVAIILLHTRRNRRRPVDGVGTARWEIAHAAVTIMVASSVGSIAAMTLLQQTASIQMVGTALLFGYCSGVVSRLSIRPRIALTALTLSAGPAIVAAAWQADAPHRIVAGMIALFLVAGYESVRFTWRTAARQIGLRLDMATLARRDPLTGLANRLGLRESFRDLPRAAETVIVVHCFDLDGFKAVNDRLGHAAGDALLQALAARLRSLLADGDVAARTGGDEFVVIQHSVPSCDEMGLHAQWLARALAEPYPIGGEAVRVGVSLGTASAPSGCIDLDALLAEADAMSYRVKNGRGGIAVRAVRAVRADESVAEPVC